MVLIIQVAGLVVVSILVDSFSRGLLYDKECGCFFVFWWGWISNCPRTIRSDIIPLRIYLFLRILVLLQCAFAALAMKPRRKSVRATARNTKSTTYATSAQAAITRNLLGKTVRKMPRLEALQIVRNITSASSEIFRPPRFVKLYVLGICQFGYIIFPEQRSAINQENDIKSD